MKGQSAHAGHALGLGDYSDSEPEEDGHEGKQGALGGPIGERKA